MKKKIIVVMSLSVAAPLVVFLYLFFTQPLFASKVFELCRVIDLRKTLPEGRFLQVSIGGGEFEKNYQAFFEVPPDKMVEFEAGFRRCVQNAAPLKGMLGCLSPELRIKTVKGEYSAYICYDDDDVTIYRNDIFHRGFISRELRKVFYDAGLKYTEGCPKPPRKRDVNECLEDLRHAGLKAAEYGSKRGQGREKGGSTI